MTKLIEKELRKTKKKPYNFKQRTKNSPLKEDVNEANSKSEKPVSPVKASSRPQHEFVVCPTCSARVKKKNLEKHTLKHRLSTIKKELKKCSPQKIHLISRRGTKLTGLHACDGCKKTVCNPIRYAQSNRGSVVLCAICKPRVYLRSFPRSYKRTHNESFKDNYNDSRPQFESGKLGMPSDTNRASDYKIKMKRK